MKVFFFPKKILLSRLEKKKKKKGESREKERMNRIVKSVINGLIKKKSNYWFRKTYLPKK